MVFRIIEKYEQDQLFGDRNQRDDYISTILNIHIIHGRYFSALPVG